ncbi:hypothetical protein FNW25_10785 [Flavobacterium franklandianum]|uniref:glycoside hydrolase family 3 C-terminal domain-containing protein n=1 Tax=Flavobacterium franklandianum TaxID=2594430 RepID=UPI00117B8368|nr:glycoside hydrolase family 3 C-terminal domain-containing protein [Flavobacterium franklandianum]TRX24830.1 hypothetical protein FNW25_10785 [Flavobacterium franklandianum]
MKKIFCFFYLKAFVLTWLMLPCFGSFAQSFESIIPLEKRLDDILSKLATQEKIIFVLSNGRSVELGDIESLSDAILEICQPRIAGGTPLEGLVSGRLNFSKKRAITFPLVTGQIPIYCSMHQPERPKIGGYKDVSNEPKYWFGHGWSYMNFSYRTVKLSSNTINKKSKLVAEFEVTNSGTRTGKQTAFDTFRTL